LEVAVDHFIEWLAEWGRDVRRRQRGLLLSTAHRAKGLEFDHIVVLDGGWSKVGTGEDLDAPRRLYYVAMTRARQTLALVRFQQSRRADVSSSSGLVREPAKPVYGERLHSLPYRFPDNGSILHREPVAIPADTSELSRQYRRPTLREVDLGFSGRRTINHPVHHAIAALSTGDPLETRINENGRWEILDGSETVVGRLAEVFEPPPGMQCTSATVYAVVSWSRDATDLDYQKLAKCDTWEVVVPELVFEPVNGQRDCASSVPGTTRNHDPV
jgi:ATP-dependent DNA helicase RecQ